MFFDSSLHTEAWSKIFQELRPEDTGPLDPRSVCGANNAAILKNIAPWLTDDQIDWYSRRKEALYRKACKENPEKVHLVSMTESFLDELQRRGIPFGLASASIMDNVKFYFDTFGLSRWFKIEDVVFDDGTYPHKGAMHHEAARRLKVDVKDCLLIEDSPHAIELAAQNNTGCIVAIGNTASPAELLHLGASHYIRDFSEFDYAWLDQD